LYGIAEFKRLDPRGLPSPKVNDCRGIYLTPRSKGNRVAVHSRRTPGGRVGAYRTTRTTADIPSGLLRRDGHFAAPFSEAHFFRCIPGWGRPAVWFLWIFRRTFFENDFRMIGEVADSTNLRSFLGALETFAYRNRESGLLRERLHLRMSARLLLKFGSKYLRHTDRAERIEQQDALASVQPVESGKRPLPQPVRRF
jgi:hypothetical protein